MRDKKAYDANHYLLNREKMCGQASKRYNDRKAKGLCVACGDTATKGLRCEKCATRRKKIEKKANYKTRFQVYGITEEEYRFLVVQQDNKCGICGRPFIDTPHIDHNHETGEVRGLLCSKCNKGLGLFDDNPDYLEKASLWSRRTEIITLGKE